MANPFAKVRTLTVNNVTSGQQNGQIVQTAANGNVLVFWTQSPGNYRIQTFDTAGNELSAEIATTNARVPLLLQNGNFAVLDRVSSNTFINLYGPDGTFLGASPNLAISGPNQLLELSNGTILLASSGPATSTHGQLLNAALQPVGGSFEIDGARSAGSYLYEAVPGGGFIAYVWGQAAPFAQRFAADGSKIGAPITMEGKLLDVAVLADGGFVLTVSRLAVDGSSWGIVAQVFNADGSPRTSEFIANTTTFGDQSYSDVTAVGDDLFLITWLGRGQLFDVNGRKIGSETALPDTQGNGWRFGIVGQSTEAHEDGFVTSSEIGGDITLAYWEVDRANILLGTAAGETFDGGGAAERIMVGYGGDDTYNVDSAGDEVQEIAGEGNDIVRAGVSYALAAGSSVETLATADDAGTAAINLTGNALAQTIRGNAGANQLTGGGGGDTLIGLGGNDFYFVGNSGDIVQEANGGGSDRVFASVNYVLTAGAEVEIISTNLSAATVAINLTGNSFTQAIYGNAGANQLNGGGGVDSLVGFEGNDSYVIVDGRENIFESANGGDDRVFTAVDYRLRAGASVEQLSTDLDAGTAAIDITGNEFAQTIRGNAGNNILDGGAGRDILIGLGGNDFYYVDDALDAVQEAIGGGSDRVLTSVSYKLAEGAEVEMFTTTSNLGTGAINLYGNALAQSIYGNAGNNQLNGGGGADNLIGFEGDDWYYIVSGQEAVFESAGGGNDRVFAAVDYVLRAGAQVEILSTDLHAGTAAIDITGNEVSQLIYGNAGNNILNGGAGKDTLIGNGGADIFLFSTALNTAPGTAFAALAATANVDRIDGFAFDDRIGLDATRFGLTPGALAPGAFVLGTAALDANDRIIYNQATGALMFDADGSGAGAAQLFAYMNGPFSLDSSYFVVI